jgi:excisionase family DNA binding protein
VANEPSIAADGVPQFLTVEEAAAVLRIGRTSAYELARRWLATSGREGLPVIRLGRTLRVPQAALERLAHRLAASNSTA